MKIVMKGRNVPVTDEIRSYTERRFRKIAKQVSDLAELEIELIEERNPAISLPEVAEATLHLKGITLRARDASRDMKHAIHLISEELQRQVEKHRAKRWHLRDRSRRAMKRRQTWPVSVDYPPPA